MSVQFVTRPFEPENRRNGPDMRLVHILTENGPSKNAVGGIILFRNRCFIFAAKDAKDLIRCEIDTIFMCARHAAWNRNPQRGLKNMRMYFSSIAAAEVAKATETAKAA